MLEAKLEHSEDNSDLSVDRPEQGFGHNEQA